MRSEFSKEFQEVPARPDEAWAGGPQCPATPDCSEVPDCSEAPDSPATPDCSKTPTCWRQATGTETLGYGNCHAIVLGAGALGLPVAADLAKLFSVEVAVKKFVERTLRFSVSACSQAGAGASSLKYSIPCFTKEEMLQGSWVLLHWCTEEVLLFSLLPADIADEETIDFVHCLLLSMSATCLHPRVTVVLGNNGQCNLAAWRPFANRITFVRALFSTGFFAQLHGQEKTISHSGGHTVHYAEINLRGPLAEGRVQSALKSVMFQKWQQSANGDSHSFFKPDFQENMLYRELEKFFVNLMLAFFAGPAKVTNGQALEESQTPCGAARLENWSKVFALYSMKNGALMGGGGTCPELALWGECLVAAFKQVASCTSPNVNSVSAAFLNGKVSTFAYFFERSVNMLKELGVAEEFQWREELRIVRKQWDLIP